MMFLLASVSLIASLGCGPKSDRFAVSGAVTLDGAPLGSGSIRFTSVGVARLMTSGALIRDGFYDIPQQKGLRVGIYQVEINSPDEKARPVLDKPSGMMMAPERIPPEYNVQTTQSIEVTADGNNEFNFDVVRNATK